MYLRFVALLFYLLLFVVACSDKDKNAGGTSEAENSIAIENKDIAGESVEDLDIFGNADGDAVLLAISIIMQAGRSEGEFSLSLADLAKDIEEDGVWNDSLERAQSADNAFEVELAQVRENILGWNISQKISMFENYVEYFWSDVFGLGRCTEKREGEIRPDTNPKSRYFNEKFICEKLHWHLLGKKLSSSSAEESSSSIISTESSSSSANDSSESGDSSSSGKSSSSEKNATPTSSENSSSSVKQSSSSQQSATTIVSPYDENTSIIDPELLAILGTCNSENESAVKKVYNNSFVCKIGLWYSPLLVDMEQDSWFNPKVTYGTLIDQRDGQSYKTVVVGTQKWMAENLHYAGEKASEELAANMADENLCPSGDNVLCKKTGYVYTWTAAVNISPIYQQRQATSLPIGEEHQGICPDGWHVPSLDEWYALLKYIAPSDYHGGTYALKSQDSWIYNDRDYVPTNSIGFSAVATGCDYNWEQGKCAAFHTASHNTSEICSGGNFNYWTDQADFGGRFSSTLASVRCVENAAP